ncbi:MAG: PAS domain S-box protein, partial [Methylococcus sp.]
MLNHIPIPLAISSVDTSSRVLFLNEAFARAFGYSADDLSTVEDWARAAYRNVVMDDWQCSLAEALAKQGRIASSLVRDVDGQPLYFIFQVQDITARKQAEDELRRAQAEILRQAVERSQFDECERLLQDLHDGFGSQLTSARLRVEEGTLSQAEL